MVTCKSKLRSFAFAPTTAVRAAKRAGSKGEGAAGGHACLARLALSLSNNVLEVMDLLAPGVQTTTGAVAAADVTQVGRGGGEGG